LASVSCSKNNVGFFGCDHSETGQSKERRVALSRKTLWVAGAAGLAVLVGLAFFGSYDAPLLGSAGVHAQHYLNLPIFDLGTTPVTILFLIKVGVFLIVLGFVASFLLHILQRRVLKYTPLAPPQQYAVARVASYVIFGLGLVIGLESLGLNLNSLVLVGGALGLGVGLGLQTVVANFVAGLILLFEQPIRIGDRIEVGDTYGDVVEIRGRSTWVRTNDNILIVVPNSYFITNKLINLTLNDPEVRMAIPVGVGYKSDPQTVREILLRIARENPNVLEDPPPMVVFDSFGDNSLNFILRVWTVTMVKFPSVLKSDLYFAIFEAFTKTGIEMPFPQRDLHLRSVDAEAWAAMQDGASKAVGDSRSG
jgi:small-conductance mechanosensitive channel